MSGNNSEKEEIQIKTSVHVSALQLYRYNLYHCFCNSTNGAAGIILGIVCILYGVCFREQLTVTNSVIITMLGVVFLVYNPISLFISSKSRYMSNDALKKPLQYCFDEKGFIISQGEVSEDMEWSDLYKVVETKECLYFFFTKVHANIVPKECLGDNVEIIYDLINKNLSKKANKLKKEHKS